MKPQIVTVVGSAGGISVSPAFIVDNLTSPTNIGIGLVVSGVHTVADIQHTFADWSSVNINSAVSAVAWSNNATLVSATQAGAINGAYDTAYNFPPTAIRLRVRALASASVGEAATATFIQSGPR